MGIHVGINPAGGEVSYFYEAEKPPITEDIIPVNYDDSHKAIELMFKRILAKIKEAIVCNIPEDLKCLCIAFDPGYGNKIRKQFIEEGHKCGFKNVETISFLTAFYLTSMPQISYKPINDEIIWIKYTSFFLVWKIIDQKAEFIGQWEEDPSNLKNIDKIVTESHLKRGPDVVLNDNVQNIFPLSVKFFAFNYGYLSQGALIKARITAGDEKFVHLDVKSFLSLPIQLKLNEEVLILFEAKQNLPIIHTQTLRRSTSSDILKIISGPTQSEAFNLPNFEQICLTFKVDTNEIYSVSLKEIPVEYNFVRDAQRLNKSTPSSHFQEFQPAKIYTIPLITTPVNTELNGIGIDLGTSRCCAAVNRRNGLSTIPLDNTNERLLPSYVAYDEKNVKCGKIVMTRLDQCSKSTVFDCKRIIGRNFNDIEIDESWPFTVVNEKNKVYIEIDGFIGKRKITAEEISADLLKHIKLKAEEFQGKILTQTVITVPATFNEIQAAATISAAKLAGWKEIVLLPESIAAAFAYFFNRPMPKNSNVLVFDLGGGTLDVCIFNMQNHHIKIISNTGNSKLGGRDFDAVLVDYFKDVFRKEYGISEFKDKNKHKLMLECQKIKEDLSAEEECTLDISDYDPTQDEFLSITRAKFENITQNLLNKIKNTIHAALHHSKYEANQINQILQVGGGSRMPMIKNMLHEMFPNAQHCCEEHLDEVVAIGAAYYANSVFSA